MVNWSAKIFRVRCVSIIFLNRSSPKKHYDGEGVSTRIVVVSLRCGTDIARTLEVSKSGPSCSGQVAKSIAALAENLGQ